MKYLNGVLTIIAVILSLILLKLVCIDTSINTSNKSLISSNQQLESSISEFRKLLEPIVKRYFKK